MVDMLGGVLGVLGVSRVLGVLGVLGAAVEAGVGDGRRRVGVAAVHKRTEVDRVRPGARGRLQLRPAARRRQHLGLGPEALLQVGTVVAQLLVEGPVLAVERRVRLVLVPDLARARARPLPRRGRAHLRRRRHRRSARAAAEAGRREAAARAASPEDEAAGRGHGQGRHERSEAHRAAAGERWSSTAPNDRN